MTTMTRGAESTNLLGHTLLLVAAGLGVTALTAHLLSGLHIPNWLCLVVGFLGTIGCFIGALSVSAGVSGFAGAPLYFAGTACMGVLYTSVATAAAKHPGFGHLVDLAAFATAALFGVLSLVANAMPQVFIGMGRFLMAGLMVLLVVSVIGLFVHAPAFNLAISAGGILLFTGFVLYDVSTILEGDVKNPVEGAIQLYLDAMNLFVDILNLLGQSRELDD